MTSARWPPRRWPTFPTKLTGMARWRPRSKFGTSQFGVIFLQRNIPRDVQLAMRVTFGSMRTVGLLLLTLLAAQASFAGEFVRREVPLEDGSLSFLFRPGRVPALILIPGSQWDSSLWDDVVPELDRDMALVLVELRGHGHSWPPAADDSIERFGADVLRIADSLGLREFYVGGHSIGGMVALEVGNQTPQRVLGILSLEGWTNHYAAGDAFDRQMTPTFTDELRRKEAEGRARATGYWTDEQRRAFGAIWKRWDGSRFLEMTAIPVLELYGDRGRPKPTRQQLRIPLRENITLRWIEGASHNLPLQTPVEVGHAIKRFLKEVERKGFGGLTRGHLDVEGRHISYLLRSGSPNIVLIHGSRQDSRQWDEVTARLNKEWGLVLVDLPGHGRSSHPRATPSIEQFAKDVLRVVDHLEIARFYTGGHSLGGMTSLEIGRVRPESVVGVISIEGWTNHHAATDSFSERMYVTMLPEQREEELDRRARATGHWTEEQKASWGAPWKHWDGSRFLRSTNLPILELWGDRAGPKPTLAQLRIPERKNITVRWVEGASHNLTLEGPEAVAEAITQFVEDIEE